MMTVAILGGSFDPPHNGHILLARESLKYADRIWLMPVYKHNFNKNSTDAFSRLNMCRIATESETNIEVSDYEIRNKLEGGTLRLLNNLWDSYPNIKFKFIIGQDNADRFNEWINYNTLISGLEFIVFSRQGGKKTAEDLWYMRKPHIFVNTGFTDEISSTKIRNDIKNNKKPSNLNENVYKFIRTLGMYL